MKNYIKFLIICLLLPIVAVAQQRKEPARQHLNMNVLPPQQFGNYFNLYVGNRMPFTDASVPGANGSTLYGRFLIDLGTDTTVVDPLAFKAGFVPTSPNHQYSVTFQNGVYFGPYTQYCNIQDCSGFGANGIIESGIIGTDILSKTIITLDYEAGRIYLSSDTNNCGKPNMMKQYGFVPVTTKGYYKNHPDNIPNHNNNPMIPIVIGDNNNSAQALAFMDSGYDDRCYVLSDPNTFYTHIININQEYLQLLLQKGVQISVDKTNYYTLKNITGKPDTLFKCTFAKKYVFNAIGLNGEKVLPYTTDECNVFLKVNAPGGRSAGGITDYGFPAVQIGGSMLMDYAQITIDPFRAIIWFKQRQN